MASYVGHLTCSSILALGYGCLGYWGTPLDWGAVFLGAGLTAVGGLLPDLDSDSGVPVREMFTLVAVVIPMLIHERLIRLGLSPDQTLVVLAAIYLVVRFGLSRVFKRFTVHRGMFHSIPAMAISGLSVYLMFADPEILKRLYMAAGVMIGFLSHLVLDEMYSVDFMGVTVKRNKYAGTAVKFYSPSWPATIATYIILGVLIWRVWAELNPS